MSKKVLLIENDGNKQLLHSKTDILRIYGNEVVSTGYLEEAEKLLGSGTYSTVVYFMEPRTEKSVEFIPTIRKEQPQAKILVCCSSMYLKDYEKQIMAANLVPVKIPALMRDISSQVI